MKKKTPHKVRDTRVSVSDFSATRLKGAFAVFLIGAFFLAIFPYRSITRDHASYPLLTDYYVSRVQNIFYDRQDAYTRSDAVRVATSIPAVMYHGVMDRPDPYNIGTHTFHEHLTALKEAGWETVTMEEFRGFMGGEITLPEKSFLLTFDDGRKDSFYPVDPLLERLGYTAVQFVLPQYSIDHENVSPYYLNQDHITKMHASGRWDIESHTWDAHSHFPLSADTEDRGIFLANLLWDMEENRQETPEEFRVRVREDLERSDQSIKKYLGKDVTTIAFPFGNYGNAGYNYNRAQEVVLEEASAIHDYGFTQIRSGVFSGHGVSANYPDGTQFLINRVDVNPQWSGDTLVHVLDGGRDRVLPLTASMVDFFGWISPEGIARHSEAGIALRSSTSERRASVFLDGGMLWRDYIARVRTRIDIGDRVVLTGRDDLQDGGVSCVFEDGRISVRGPGFFLAQTPLISSAQEIVGEHLFGIELSGERGSCTMNSQELRFIIRGALQLHYKGRSACRWKVIQISQFLL